MDKDLAFLKVQTKLGYDFSGDIKIGGKYSSLIEHNGLVFISGQIPRVGDIVHVYGKVGLDVDVSQAQLAAKISTMRALAILKQHYATLNVIEKVLQMNVFVHSTAAFIQQSEVSDGASEILYEILGCETGQHTRTSVSVYQLPKNASVEINFVFAIKA
ncbi:RidA family protein [Acinetobacter guerrae]|uniref:RidA family protein n=1 Tax=Acinetobacter guerrae TaxID=1843371 RepID=A0A3A8EPK1_9GAMM|nr:RidA family protein [Acinetobacter guerrae]RKG36049.1 RidA family protein [Acinetobacter guerrae]